MTTQTISSGYPDYLALGEEARDHSDLAPQFSDDDTPGGDDVDPAAPYGRKADGTPKAKPGRPKGTPDTAPRTRTTQRRARVAAAPPRRTSKPKQAKQQGPDYRPGIVGIAQLIAAPLMVAGISKPALRADAAAIVLHAEGIAEAMQQTAEQVPQFGAVLDKILSVGPYGALLAATMPLAVQLAANHNVLPGAVAGAMGAMPAADLLTQLEDDAQAA